MPPLVTVVVLLYNARRAVPALLDGVARQTHPNFVRQSDWLECIIVDDCSNDATAEEVRRILAEMPEDRGYVLDAHTVNQGLALSVNRAFELAQAPYVLTCHCDCFFGDDRYVARLLELIAETPDAGAITGKPALPEGRSLPFAERVNAVANLMDILPVETTEALVAIGFAEGRCDVFRAQAVRAAGMYQTSYRTAGEDQALAARMREHGYNLYQAPAATYFLSVSDEQDTIAKLIRHSWLFGKMHPLLLFADPGTRAGVIGRASGANRRARAMLRGLQIVSVVGYLAIVALLLLHLPLAIIIGVLVAIVVAKLMFFRRHIGKVGFSALELIEFLALQPLLDIAYVAGLVRGVTLLAGGWRRTRTAA